MRLPVPFLSSILCWRVFSLSEQDTNFFILRNRTFPHISKVYFTMNGCVKTTIDKGIGSSTQTVKLSSVVLQDNPNPFAENIFNHRQSLIDREYQKAVETLNKLQSNEAVLQKIRKEKPNSSKNNIPLVQKYLDEINISQEHLRKLSIIHVAGTKGKGSTCAFIERILREYGYKTGFYSSPHLVAVRERIRINGQPISREAFSSYFWQVYSKIQCKDDAMPAYFKFLTILAFHVFVKERVDVAIMEVGIGGEYDCTNVVEHPTVCAITTLDYDHTSILGSTIESIAWHKAGIMKESVPLFTVKQNYLSTMKILEDRALEKNCDLWVVPPLEQYEANEGSLELGLKGDVQRINASLALQVSHYWLNRKKKIEVSCESMCEAFQLDNKDKTALSAVAWPGRSQILRNGLFSYFLDGAHTIASIRECCHWFNNSSPQYSHPLNGPLRILLFNVTGERNCENLLRLLYPLNFDVALFTTNLAVNDVTASSDQKNYTVSEKSQLDRCERMRSIWLKLSEENSSTSEDDSCLAFGCISDAVQWMTQFQSKKQPVHVLITGSLHLIGGFIGVVDPSLRCFKENHSK